MKTFKFPNDIKIALEPVYPWENGIDNHSVQIALDYKDFEEAARRLGCSVAAIRAVWEVEASGRHFLSDGSVIRRFEPHHFPKKYWSRIGFTPREGELPWRASLRLSTEKMFRDAVNVDAEAAMRASSWGGPQIMGFNCQDAGFETAEELVIHMAKGAAHQLGAFVQLVEGWNLTGALRAQDWRAFARGYNGSGQVDEYARRMERAYRKHSGGETSPVVLRVGDRGEAVTRLQRALGVPDDGAFGPGTLQAVRDFQSKHGLTVDGIVGAKTWEQIKSLGAKPVAQEVPIDDLVKKAQQVAAASAAVITTGEGLRRIIPDDLLWLPLSAAAFCAVMLVAAWTWRWVRSK